ncbi:putative TonB-dependent receptor BfrD [compost metagenome]
MISASHINVDKLPPGRYKPAGPQAYGRDATSKMWINQTSLTAGFDTFGLGHTLVGGLEVSRETYDRDVYSYGLKFPDNGYPLANPPGYWSGPTDKGLSSLVETRLIDRALYAFDTIALHEMWDLSLGLRYDWVDGDAENRSLAKGAWTTSGYSSSDERLSSRAGLVFKPVDYGRIYVAYGNSFNPSAENLATSGSGLSEATQKLGPEKNRTWELGTKWELLERRLGLDAAIFQVEKTNARVTMADGSTALAGDRRVQGIELAATGKLTEQWSLFANFTFLDSEVRKDANTPKGLATVGQALANTPPRSFNLWTTYDLPGDFRIGYGTRYVSERNLTSSNDRIKLDEYWLHNAMLGYKASETLDLQLNLNNLFDKDYVERVRTTLGDAARSSAVEYGDARSAVLSATLSF